MHNYGHKKIIETIIGLDKMPSEPENFAEWLEAEAHLTFLRENAESDEIVIFANGEYSYIDSIVVPRKSLAKISAEDLEQWHFDSYRSIASYVHGGGKKLVWIERGVPLWYESKQKGTQLVFNRTFEGWQGQGRDYIEINQEYTHITGIHWRPEKRAYCRFDERGDLQAAVSITTREDKGNDIALVTFKWEALEEYLSAADSVLLRRFDFTLLNRGQFNGWPQASPEIFPEREGLSYHQLVVHGHAAYTAGRQLIHPRRQRKAIHERIKNGGEDKYTRKYAEFIAYDWRNRCVAMISTAPHATCNYFNANDNRLPFELSPAFFRPEVLSKYKTDREKYTIAEREVTCRTAWSLRGIDVNEAGQIHAYICDLRKLPYEEQLHWLGHNEQPKAAISKRAIINDFQGDFVSFSEPPIQLLSKLRGWHEANTPWWILRDKSLLDHVNTPLTQSRDEWAEAFMDLAKLVNEGFDVSPIRKRLDEFGIAYSKEDRTIALLEKLFNRNILAEKEKRLDGLRTVQQLRSKAKGHVAGSEAAELAQQALMEHETFSNHFKHVCNLVIQDLNKVETFFS